MVRERSGCGRRRDGRGARMSVHRAVRAVLVASVAPGVATLATAAPVAAGGGFATAPAGASSGDGGALAVWIGAEMAALVLGMIVLRLWSTRRSRQSADAHRLAERDSPTRTSA